MDIEEDPWELKLMVLCLSSWEQWLDLVMVVCLWASSEIIAGVDDASVTISGCHRHLESVDNEKHDLLGVTSELPAALKSVEEADAAPLEVE